MAGRQLLSQRYYKPPKRMKLLLRLRLSRPKANIIDAGMIAALDGALAGHLDNASLAAVLLDAEGPHFSFGASVAEHLPGECAGMLRAIHHLILR